MFYNNNTEKSKIVTKTYSKSRIDDLKERVELNNISYLKFRLQFRVQCLRKTYQGYYAVLSQSDGDYAYVFIDEKFKLYDLFVVDEFKTKDEFLSLLCNKTNINSIIEIDPNTVYFPISAMDMTAHIVKEGIVIIKYNRLVDGKISEPSSIDSIEFISNDDLSAEDHEFIAVSVPHILEIDKISN